MKNNSRFLVVFRNREQADEFLSDYKEERQKQFISKLGFLSRVGVKLAKFVLGWNLMPTVHHLDARKPLPRDIEKFESNDLIILDNISCIESMEQSLFRKRTSHLHVLEICRYAEASIVLASQPEGYYRHTYLLSPELPRGRFYLDDDVLARMAKFLKVNPHSTVDAA